jgi:hypothetical protein|tara:strand:+ start:1015 stop:1185 length:171 start_codon:yes stop_codon:yes gene_type:complete
MTWKIIDEDTDAIECIEEIIYQAYNDPAYIKAFERVKDLAKKGMIAEKYMKEWGKQ